ncbi:MAG: hypothetical protein AAFQ07_04575 [Chloroflexota bacterium]
MNTNDKMARRVVIDPLLALLKSRRVLVALIALLVGMLMQIVPALAPLESELMILLVSLALALIGGYSLEDAVIAARQTPNDQALRDEVDALLDAILDIAMLNLDMQGDVDDMRSTVNVKRRVPDNPSDTLTG